MFDVAAKKIAISSSFSIFLARKDLLLASIETTVPLDCSLMLLVYYSH